jgi:hypothetical protein
MSETAPQPNNYMIAIFDSSIRMLTEDGDDPFGRNIDLDVFQRIIS